jgi:hypothetical protein
VSQGEPDLELPSVFETFESSRKQDEASQSLSDQDVRDSRMTSVNASITTRYGSGGNLPQPVEIGSEREFRHRSDFESYPNNSAGDEGI